MYGVFCALCSREFTFPNSRERGRWLRAHDPEHLDHGVVLLPDPKEEPDA